ncbi:MAG: hypothetical protein H6Q18_357 [Bacteroidetes bacterium]|nr:hypothetical protein [Bacteroidota bacterium]
MKKLIISTLLLCSVSFSFEAECCTVSRTDEDGDTVSVSACRTTRSNACRDAQTKLDTICPVDDAAVMD